METTNFTFLKKHEPLFFQLATTAEKAFSADPNTTLFKLRQLGEALAQDVACRIGIDISLRPTQHELLYQLNRKLGLDPLVRDLFHTLRQAGNNALLRLTAGKTASPPVFERLPTWKADTWS